MLSRRPLVVAACMVAVGFHLSESLASHVETWVAALGLTLMMPLSVMRGWCGRKQAIFYVLLLGISVLHYQWTVLDKSSVWSVSFANPEAEMNGEWEGVILSPLELDGDRMQFQLASTGWRTSHGQSMVSIRETLLVQVKLKDKQELELAKTWKRGQLIHINGQLQSPSDAGNFGGFSYKDYLHTLRIEWLLKVSSIKHIQLHESVATLSSYEPIVLWSRMLAVVDGCREWLIGVLNRLYVQPHSGYIQGLVLGARETMDPDTYQQFSQLGLTHVLAISGLHVGVVIGALISLFRLLRVTKEASIGMTMGFIPLYILLTGASSSVIRAGVMAFLALYGAKRGLLKDGLHLLAAAFILMVIWEPRYVLQTGFQLSFIVTASLILFVPQVGKLFIFLPRALSGTLSVTLVAQVVSFPLTVYYFNQFSLLSFVANFIVVPCVSIGVLPIASISLIVGAAYEPAAHPIAWLVERMNDVTFQLVYGLSQMEGAVMIWPTPPVWWIMLYYATFAVALAAVGRWSDAKHIVQRRKGYMDADLTQPLDFIQLPKRSFRYRGSVALVAAFTFGLVVVQGYYFGYSNDAVVSFIDVGQGDSILITTSSGKHMLIDGGGTVNFHKPADHWRERAVPFEIGEKVVVPLLKKRGVRELDTVLLTHADQDHVGGLHAVLKHIPVKQLIMNGTWKSSDSLSKLYRTAINKGIPIRKWQAGQQWVLDRWSILQVMFPYSSSGASAISMEDKQNEASLVVELTLTHPKSGERAIFMLTGDLEAGGERQMLRHSVRNQSRPIDVLKVAHHGSKTSTTSE